MNIAVLITCHNRRETTLRCLDALACAACEVRSKSEEGRSAEFHVFLVDDGSTDGTGEKIREYADQGEESRRAKGEGEQRLEVHLIQGNGKLYWARGMALAWREALKYESIHHCSPSSSSFAFILWLNDDTILRPDSLYRVLETERAAETSAPTVVVGEMENSRGEIVYGKRGDLFTGNFVLVPRSVYEKIGMICDGYRHAWADSDYALRCKRAGVPVVSCGVVGQCEGHPNRPSLVGIGFGRRCRMLWDPKGWCVHDLWLYRRRNWGLCAAVFSCAHLIAHVILGEQ